MSKLKKQIWVHPDFARTIKASASIEGKDIIDFSKELSCNIDELYRVRVKKNKEQEKINEKYKFSF